MVELEVGDGVEEEVLEEADDKIDDGIVGEEMQEVQEEVDEKIDDEIAGTMCRRSTATWPRVRPTL